MRVMPSPEWQLFDNSSGLQNTVLAAGDETLVLAGAISQVGVSSGIVALGAIFAVPGAGVSGIVVRIRAGYGTSGAIVYEPVTLSDGGVTVTPGNAAQLLISGPFKPGAMQQPGGGQFSVTAQQVGTAPADGQLLNASVAWFNIVAWDVEL